ncbi:hypothetical protein BD413DRAFT_543978 [Trametes elegans]|nr:hypothetical protein BD413DRAFT_543978 [Trametes elegans]
MPLPGIPQPSPARCAHPTQGSGTPMIPKESSSGRTAELRSAAATTKRVAEARRKNLAAEVDWAILPVDEWFELCLPGKNLPRGVVPAPFSVVVDHHEKNMYPGLCKGFNAILKALNNKSFIMKVTGDNPDTIAPGSEEDRDHNALKPDLAMYPNVKEAVDDFTVPEQKQANTEDKPKTGPKKESKKTE